MLSRSDGWFRLSHYQSIQELQIPLLFALGITADSVGIGLSQLKKLTVGAYPMGVQGIARDEYQLRSRLTQFAETFATPSLRHSRLINTPSTEPSDNTFIPKDDLVEIQRSHFVGFDCFSFQSRTSRRWEFQKGSETGSWTSVDPLDLYMGSNVMVG
ncbi:hypothetical protein GYMLUDRAFT_689988 [Collybiopsis luxurians FD-317 M1]|uniref:Uncharacterized protein n=1 Tax=Collybiopsis luxurians FD-317 M1 TaxID=944289 RepID=A0A0D0B5X2_9AGAR|nr:hypothetical protein GYMLUDRAFT_689988 [Collybiopsis luxurians FD-317 M1]